MDVAVDVLSYKELQQVAKQVGLKANQKFSTLRKDVRKWQLANKGGKENEDVVLTPSKTPRGKDAATPRVPLTPRDPPKNPTTPKAPSVRATEVTEDPVPDPPIQSEPTAQPPAVTNHAAEAPADPTEEDLKAQIYAEIKARTAQRREEVVVEGGRKEPQTASKDTKSPWRKLVSSAARGMENLEDYLARKNQRRQELMSGKKVPVGASKSTPSLAHTSTLSLASVGAQTPSVPRAAPKTPTTSRGPAPKTPVTSAVPKKAHGALPRNKSTGNLPLQRAEEKNTVAEKEEGRVEAKGAVTPSTARKDQGPVSAAGGAGDPPRPPHGPMPKTTATQQPAIPRAKSVSSLAATAKAHPSVPPKHIPASAKPLVPKFAPATERKRTFGGFIDSLPADTQAQANQNAPPKNSTQSTATTRPIAIARPTATVKGASRPPTGPPPKPAPHTAEPGNQSDRKNLKRPAGSDETDHVSTQAKRARLMTSGLAAPKVPTTAAVPVQGPGRVGGGVKRRASDDEVKGDVTASAAKTGPQAKRPKFDLEASLQRPLTYVPYSGKLLDVTESYTAKKKQQQHDTHH